LQGIVGVGSFGRIGRRSSSFIIYTGYYCGRHEESGDVMKNWVVSSKEILFSPSVR
jgi:hypothetical protein